jgi:hypothetical protein
LYLRHRLWRIRSARATLLSSCRSACEYQLKVCQYPRRRFNMNEELQKKVYSYRSPSRSHIRAVPQTDYRKSPTRGHAKHSTYCLGRPSAHLQTTSRNPLHPHPQCLGVQGVHGPIQSLSSTKQKQPQHPRVTRNNPNAHLENQIMSQK